MDFMDLIQLVITREQWKKTHNLCCFRRKILTKNYLNLIKILMGIKINRIPQTWRIRLPKDPFYWNSTHQWVSIQVLYTILSKCIQCKDVLRKSPCNFQNQLVLCAHLIAKYSQVWYHDGIFPFCACDLLPSAVSTCRTWPIS